MSWAEEVTEGAKCHTDRSTDDSQAAVYHNVLTFDKSTNNENYNNNKKKTAPVIGNILHISLS
jgi:hypothetical protein